MPQENFRRPHASDDVAVVPFIVLKVRATDVSISLAASNMSGSVALGPKPTSRHTTKTRRSQSPTLPGCCRDNSGVMASTSTRPHRNANTPTRWGGGQGSGQLSGQPQMKVHMASRGAGELLCIPSPFFGCGARRFSTAFLDPSFLKSV